MAKGGVVQTGLDELRAWVRALPANLKAEAVDIVAGTGDNTVHDIVLDYPHRSGDLRKGVRLVPIAAGAYGAGVKVVNRSKIADIFEKGSEARHYYTVKGKKKLLGRMPANPVFARAGEKNRRAMNTELVALLVRTGAIVTEAP